MRAAAWHGGPDKTSGAGYGVRISHADRDAQFNPSWTSVTVAIAGVADIRVPISRSFWRLCSELRSAEIGRWMLRKGLAPWPKGRPPVFELTPLAPAKFALHLMGK